VAQVTNLKYAKIDSITRRLAGRITVVDLTDYGITGITGTEIGTDIIEIIGLEKEEFIDMYLSMIYVFPLINEHPFLQAIVEKLVISDVYYTYFPTMAENSENTDTFAGIMRQQALNDFQSLFNGLGIFIPGSSNQANSIQNDENKYQMANKAVMLMGEKIKPYIGYDMDGDGTADSDLYKLNTNVSPSFYSPGDMSLLGEGEDIIDGIRVRPRYTTARNKADINFW
jgi:hypothetical protein